MMEPLSLQDIVPVELEPALVGELSVSHCVLSLFFCIVFLDAVCSVQTMLRMY